MTQSHQILKMQVQQWLSWMSQATQPSESHQNPHLGFTPTSKDKTWWKLQKAKMDEIFKAKSDTVTYQLWIEFLSNYVKIVISLVHFTMLPASKVSFFEAIFSWLKLVPNIKLCKSI